MSVNCHAEVNLWLKTYGNNFLPPILTWGFITDICARLFRIKRVLACRRGIQVREVNSAARTNSLALRLHRTGRKSLVRQMFFRPTGKKTEVKKQAPVKTTPSLAPFLILAAISAFATSTAAALPTVSITASSSSISSGQTDTLTVTETNAASIHVTGSNGTSYTLPYSGGTLTVAPTSTTTYTAMATNSSGSATAQTTITVTAGSGSLPVVSITASSSSISSGLSDTLTVTAT